MAFARRKSKKTRRRRGHKRLSYRDERMVRRVFAKISNKRRRKLTRSEEAWVEAHLPKKSVSVNEWAWARGLRRIR